MADTQTSEWVEHKGKRRPVHHDEIVSVKFSSGMTSPILISAGHLDWVHRGDNSDVIAYRVVKP